MRTSSTAPTRLPSGSRTSASLRAKVLGADKRTDIRAAEDRSKDLPKVTIGDPDKLRVGEWAYVANLASRFLALENTIDGRPFVSGQGA